MARVRHEDWLELGLAALAETGPEALTIDALCQRARRTKGSFYHHFETIDAYRLELAEFWRKRDTEAIIAATSEPRLAAENLGALNRLTSHLDMSIEQGMRRLGATDRAVADVIRTVDRRRIGHLVKLYVATGDFAPESAELLAQVTYAAFVGFQVIAPEMKPEVSQQAYLKFMGLLKRG
jgi:AcrR family transcriptional regulator